MKLKEDLLHKLDGLSPYLPHNTLDELVMGLGGSHAVAEVSCGSRPERFPQSVPVCDSSKLCLDSQF